MQGLFPFQYWIEFVATTAFAVSGITQAARRGFDVVGVFAVAGLAAFGGGTLRDILLDRRPFFWVEYHELLWLVLVLVVLSMTFIRSRHLDLTDRTVQWPDAIGMGLFAASGTHLAFGLGLPMFVSVLMGVITAVFGGVLRDIVCNDIPKVFHDHRPYALCAFLGGWTYILADHLILPVETSILASAGVASLSRLISMAFDIRIPACRGA